MNKLIDFAIEDVNYCAKQQSAEQNQLEHKKLIRCINLNWSV